MEENESKVLDTQKLNEILKVRREKLAALREAGQDPFTIVKFDRDSTLNSWMEKRLPSQEG